MAHKIGDAYDFKHDAAIVYADSPFIIVIFTNNSTYDNISQIADDVYGVLKWLSKNFLKKCRRKSISKTIEKF